MRRVFDLLDCHHHYFHRPKVTRTAEFIVLVSIKQCDAGDARRRGASGRVFTERAQRYAARLRSVSSPDDLMPVAAQGLMFFRTGLSGRLIFGLMPHFRQCAHLQSIRLVSDRC